MRLLKRGLDFLNGIRKKIPSEKANQPFNLSATSATRPMKPNPMGNEPSCGNSVPDLVQIRREQNDEIYKAVALVESKLDQVESKLKLQIHGDFESLITIYDSNRSLTLFINQQGKLDCKGDLSTSLAAMKFFQYVAQQHPFLQTQALTKRIKELEEELEGWRLTFSVDKK